MHAWLLRAGMLRRNAKPSLGEMRELLPTAAPALTCPDCGHSGLLVGNESEEEASWPGTRRCQSCGQPIQPERLEVFPAAELCVSCQGRADRGLPQQSDEFCPRCGSRMELRPTRRKGITRQEMLCSDPRCQRRG
jgi:predicted RNA-binding Zn-ribbon protein involved in translation (DUF1610 family)